MKDPGAANEVIGGFAVSRRLCLAVAVIFAFACVLLLAMVIWKMMNLFCFINGLEFVFF